MKHKRRRLIILFFILAALLIGLAAFVHIQRSNLHAFVMSLRHSEEELSALRQQSASDLFEQYGLNSDAIAQSIGESPASSDIPSDSIVEPPTEEKDLPLLPGSAESSAAAHGSVPKDSETQPSHQKQDQVLPKDVQKLVYSLYTLQSQYMGKLEGIRASALAQFKALPVEERTASKRVSIVKAGLSQAHSLESQCDVRVASVIRELRAVLKQNDLDDSVADSAENYYATQKGLVKAEYMRKYNKYLK